MNRDKTKTELIAELKQAHQRIAELEAQKTAPKDDFFASVFRANPAPMALSDLATHKYVEVNEAFLQILGFERTEIIGKSIPELGVFANLAQREESLRRLEAQGFLRGEKVLVRTKSGDLRHGVFSAEYVQANNRKLLLTIMEDVTQLQQAEETLYAENRLKATTFASLRDAVFIVDAADAKILDCNPAAEKIFGYSRDEMIGQTTNFLHVDDDALTAFREALHPTIATDGILYLPNFKMRRRDGVIFPTEHSVMPITAANNQQIGWFSVVRDITEHKQAEIKLRESEERFKAIIDHTPDHIIVQDKDLRYTMVANPQMGLTEADMIGKTDYDFMPQAEAKKLELLKIQVLESDEPLYIETSLKSAKGTEEFFEGTFVPKHDANGQVDGLIGYFKNVTRRKQLAEKEQEIQQSLALALEGANAGTWDWYVQTGEARFNPRWAEIVGYTLEELSPVSIQTWIDLSHPEDLERSNQLLQQHFRSEIDFYECEVRMKHKNGAWVWILDKGKVVAWDAAGQPLRMSGTHIDITEHKQAESALEENEQTYRSLFEYANDAIFSLSLEGVHLDANPKAAEMLGYSRDELIGLAVQDIVAPREYPDAQGKIATLLAGESLPTYERIFRKKDGAEFPVEITIALVRDAVGEPRYIQSIVRDITKRKQAEEQLRESEARFRSLFETMSQGVVYQDADGQIVSANPAAERILGISIEQMQGRTSNDPHWRAIHEDGRDFPGETHPAMVALQSGQPIKNEVMGVFNARYGNYNWININAIPQFRPGEARPFRVYTTFEDITERKINQQLLQARLRLVEFAENHNLPELMQAALDEASKLVASPIGFFHFVDADQTSLTLQAWSTRTLSEFCTADSEENHYPLAQAGVWADCARLRRPLIHNDYAALPNRKGLPEGHAPVVRQLLIPILRSDKVVAIFGVGNKPANYTATDLDIVGRLADFAWDIVARALARENLRRNEALLREAQRFGKIGHLEWHSTSDYFTASNEARRIFGFDDTSEISPQTITTLLDSETISQIQALDRDTFAQQKHVIQYEYPIHLPGDGLRWIGQINRINYNPDGKPERVLAVVQDITERKKAEAQVLMQLERIQTLNQIDRVIASSLDVHFSLRIMLDKIDALPEVDAAAVLLFNNLSHQMEYAAHKGFRSSAFARQRLDLEYGLPGHVRKTRQLLYIENLSKPNHLYRRAEQFQYEDFVSYYGVPLIAKGVFKGVLEIFCRQDYDIDDAWVNYLNTLGGQAAIAIDNAQLFENMQQSHQDLVNAYDDTIRGWSYALDLRDKETEGHSQRVTDLTVRLAQEMGISRSEIVHVRRGALLHDIGKLGVPDNILLKPGKLTNAEWALMKQHPDHALRMLMPIAYLRPAIDIPYGHHEKWDGSGYPRGLIGEQIPLAARIFAVVDVWDALRSDRPYRKAWPRQQTLEHIRSLSGTAFDPEVVTAFFKIIDEG